MEREYLILGAIVMTALIVAIALAIFALAAPGAAHFG